MEEPGSACLAGSLIVLFGTKTVVGFDPKTMAYRELTPLPKPVHVDRFFWIDNKLTGAGGEASIDLPRRRSEWTFGGRFATAP